MKRIHILALTAILILTACKNNKLTDELQQENQKLKKEVVSLNKKIVSFNETAKEKEKGLEEKENLLPTDCKFYIVIGAFLEEKRADIWIKEIGLLGYTSLKIKNENDFFCVYVKSGNSFDKAEIILDNVRCNVTENAWIHEKK